MDPEAPRPHLTQAGPPAPRYLGGRHLLIEVGDRIQLRDRTRPADQPLTEFPATKGGWAAAFAALRRLDGSVLDVRSGRRTDRHVADPEDERRRRLIIAVGSIIVLLVAGLPALKALVDPDRRPAQPRLLDSQVIGQVRASTMLVVAYKETRTAGGVLQEWHVGSGWVYDVSRGLIVTNAHVVEDGTQFRAGPSAGLRTASREALAFCGDLDLAILRVGTIGGLPALELAADGSARPGDPIYAAGYPPSRVRASQTRTLSSIPLSWSAGEIERAPSDAFGEFVYHSAELDNGNSGGPLVNTSGQLVGMNTAITRITGVGAAIPVDVLRETIERMLRHEDVCA
jgi:S1-C subfamily serine protease